MYLCVYVYVCIYIYIQAMQYINTCFHMTKKIRSQNTVCTGGQIKEMN